VKNYPKLSVIIVYKVINMDIFLTK